MNAPKIHSSVTTKVHDMNLLCSLQQEVMHCQPYTRVVVCVWKTHTRISFHSFFAVRSVAKRYILQQKCLNWQIGTCLVGTLWYNF